MSVETRLVDPGIAVVAVAGRLVLGKEVERLETAVKDLIHQGQRRFVFDLSALDYTDSSGIGTLIACLTDIRKAGGEMRVAGANDRIQRLFSITGVNHLMAVYPNVAEAAAGS